MVFINQLITGEPHIVPSLPQGKYAEFGTEVWNVSWIWHMMNHTWHLTFQGKQGRCSKTLRKWWLINQRILGYPIFWESEPWDILKNQSFRIFITEESKPFVWPNETRPDLQTNLSFPTKIVDQRGVAALWTGATVLWSPNNSVYIHNSKRYVCIYIYNNCILFLYTVYTL